VGACVSDGDVAVIRYRLGRVLWERGGDLRAASVKEFITAVQLDGRHAGSFAYLGHYYR
jgi:hypothetical protein